MEKLQQYQLKSITPIVDYKFTLSDDMRTIVEKEFRETDEVRNHAFTELREWALKNPRIVSLRLDANFLLRFLRVKKFSLPMTKETIERYLVLRQHVQDGVENFRNFDYKLPVIRDLLDLGYIFPLPKRDALGRTIIFYRIGVFDPLKHLSHHMVKLHGMTYETLMENEENQIKGFVHVIDSSGMGFNFLTLFTPHEAYRIGKNLEKLLPMRHKEFQGLKVHPTIKFAVDFALKQMSEKMRKRVFLHKKVEDITSVVDRELLPAEYGGVVPISEMISQFKKTLEENHKLVMSHDTMTVKLELYPKSVCEGSVRSLKKSIEAFSDNYDAKRETFSVQGSFRKLEID